MTGAEWLAGEDPHDMLDHLLVRVGDTPVDDSTFSVSDHKLACFAAACMEGTSKQEEWRAWLDMTPEERGANKRLTPSRAAERMVGIVSGGHLRGFVGLPRDAARRAALLREVVGNPFRPVTRNSPGHSDGEGWWQLQANGMEQEILTPEHLTPAVLKMAQHAYDTRDFSGLPIIADALEDTGCDSADLLGHLRGSDPHARGCWALDLLLGKG